MPPPELDSIKSLLKGVMSLSIPPGGKNSTPSSVWWEAAAGSDGAPVGWDQAVGSLP